MNSRFYTYSPLSAKGITSIPNEKSIESLAGIFKHSKSLDSLSNINMMSPEEIIFGSSPYGTALKTSFGTSLSPSNIKVSPWEEGKLYFFMEQPNTGFCDGRTYYGGMPAINGQAKCALLPEIFLGAYTNGKTNVYACTIDQLAGALSNKNLGK